MVDQIQDMTAPTAMERAAMMMDTTATMTMTARRRRNSIVSRVHEFASRFIEPKNCCH